VFHILLLYCEDKGKAVFRIGQYRFYGILAAAVSKRICVLKNLLPLHPVINQ
jgi:hypothetical protein